MATSSQVSEALDEMFQRPEGLYGSFDDIPVISQAGHVRRVELLERLSVGDVSKMTCVDFGMGSWGFGSVYPRMHACARAIGIDVSRTAIEMSRKLVSTSRPSYAERFETYQSDGMDLPLLDGSVDLFFSGESIEHVKFPPRYLAEIYRVLRPERQLIITTPNRDAIRYKQQDEEYCTSPEHFWLFKTPELIEAVSEFFDIKEIYGFNGSFGSHEEDRAITDRETAQLWSRQFENEPDKGTGIILRAVRRPGIDRRYVVEDVPAEAITIEGSDTYLPLEFGLKGLLLDQPGARVTITRPPSDGMVCRLWCHLWSGRVRIAEGGQLDILDLYTKVPGWRNWVSEKATTGPTTIEIAPTGQRNAKAQADQVIFYEAFTWRALPEPVQAPGRLSRDNTVIEGVAAEGYGFARYQRFVGTTVFHWFTRTDGNVRGPWQPIGGRQAWDGSVRFWRGQIKEIMLANIDAIYLHLIPTYEENRTNFFKAYAQLRSEGWDVPKVAPFLDPFGIWREAPIDLAQAEGKDAFAAHYVRFFEQYFAENQDPFAASYLLTIDGKLALTTWWVSLLHNVVLLTRDDLETRLRAVLGDRIPQLAVGTWMITTALIDPDLGFSDERMVMFSGYTYALHSVHNGIDVWHVQAGYWDQNIRTPGYLLPRDGGKNYRRAWEAVISNMPYVGRVYIESWNEYDEGSGIYSADPKGLLVDPAMHGNSDTFSDTDNPFEYIMTTSEGAARINDLPAEDAAFILSELPETVAAGTRINVRLIARNLGNARWASPREYALYVLAGEKVLHKVPIDDGFGTNSVPHRGIFRGAPVSFFVNFKLPDQSDLHDLTFSIGRGGALFGERLTLPVQPRAENAPHLSN